MRCFAKMAWLAMALLLGSTAMAQTFEQALDAYERKDYKTAFAGFMRLAQGEAAAAPEPEAAKEDQQQRVAKYRKAAQQGDAAAQFIMGLVYFDGRGVAQDDRQAEAWYRKSAEQGYASAQVNLGLMYFFGRGVSKDDQQAVAWFSYFRFWMLGEGGTPPEDTGTTDDPREDSGTPPDPTDTAVPDDCTPAMRAVSVDPADGAGTHVQLTILDRAGGGVYVALAAPATRVAVVFGADVQVLPGAALASILGTNRDAVGDISEYRQAGVADEEVKLGLPP